MRWLLLFIAGSLQAAQSYYTPMTVDHNQVPSTQTDFPVLINVTDTRLKSVANSGHVAGANGYDVRPYSDSGLTTALTYELERYNATTGEVVMWVKIASLSSSVDTVIYLGYGDAALTTDGSSTTTWSNSFVSVYHLKDGTTLSVADALNVNNGTNVNGVTAVAGQVDGAGNLAAASTQYIDLGSPAGNTAITFSCWAKATSFPAAYTTTISRVGGTFLSTAQLFVRSSGKLAIYIGATGGTVSYDGTGTYTLSTGTWYHIVATYDSSTGLNGYVNALVDGTVGASGAMSTDTETVRIGSDSGTAGREWNGVLDEVRVSNVVRTANWITTEYNNMNAPGTFMSTGTEVSLVVAPYYLMNSNWLFFSPQ